MARSWDVAAVGRGASDVRSTLLVFAVGCLALLGGSTIVLAPESAASMLAAIGLSIVGARVAHVLGGSEARVAVTIFFAALVLRMLAMLLLHELVFLQDPTIFAGDDRWYDQQAAQIAARWRGEGGIPAPGWFDYRTYVAGLAFLSDGALMVPRIVNVVLGSLAAVVFALVGGELFGARAIRWTGAAMAVWPSAVLWTSLNLRESWVLLGFGLLALGAARWFSTRRTDALVAVGIGVAFVAFGRSWILLVGLLGLAVGWVLSLRRRPGRAVVMAAFLASVVWLIWSTGVLDGYLFVLEASGVEGIRTSTAIGTSALVPTAGGVPGLALGLVNAMLRPLPWDSIDGLRQLLALPEQLIWYVVLVMGVGGIWSARRTRPEVVLPMAGVAGAIFVAIALLESNEGLIYRHRLPGVAIVLTFAVGWRAARRTQVLAASGA